MLTLKEELFVKPFQQKLFRQHKIKLELATSRVDSKQPQSWPHILLKSKKLQNEQERCTQIILNNNILWRHLGEIMNSKRVDNCWDSDRPKFFHRVNLFTKVNNKLTVDIEKPSKFVNVKSEMKNRKCCACNPNLSISECKIPEERIPWEPPKKKLSKKLRSLSVYNGDIKNVKHQISDITKHSHNTLMTIPKKKVNNKLNVNNNIMIETNNYLNYIEINEGLLDIVIKFPSGSKVSLIEGKTKRVLH